MPLRERRGTAFGLLALVCAIGVVAIVAMAVLGHQDQQRASARAVAAARPAADRILAGQGAFVTFRSLDRTHPEDYGHLAVAPLHDGVAGKPVLAGPACERLTLRAGSAVCLGHAGVTRFGVTILDRAMKARHKLSLPGVPSRTRLSPDAHWAGVTAFLTGHSYASPGAFSTAATIIDARSGRIVGDLEKDFTVTHRGARVTAADRNFWGLTFADDEDTFYATLATGGHTWLIRGSIKARRAETIHENVECPSLSPDGKRIAYKKAVGHDPTVWRFHVLDLATGRETPLAEQRPIDDQLEWLDEDTLLYRDGETIWSVPADGSGQAREWLAAADSPAVVHGPLS